MAIIDLFRGIRQFNSLSGIYGIEVETETIDAYDVPSFFFWRSHGDGSLRNFGVEYVLKQPLSFVDVKESFKEFDEKTKKIKFIRDSFSTSVHVHVNMLNETLKTMGNFITLYFLFENLLIRHSGPNRRSNLFCLPVVDAEETYLYARQMFEACQFKDYKRLVVGENGAKYAALNLSALGKFGSLEIRSFRGETDSKLILEWISIINCIYEYSRKDINPKEIMEEFKNKGMKFRDDVFGEYSKVLSCEDENEIVESNVFYAGSIAYAVKNWNELDQKEKKKFSPTKKQLDSYSISLMGKSFEDLSGGEQQYVLSVMQKDFDMGRLNPKPRKQKTNPELVQAWNMIQPALANQLVQEIPIEHDDDFDDDFAEEDQLGE